MTTEPVRLLYIDDDPALCRLVQKELARHGFETVCAQDGDAGVEALRAGRFDVVALDHYMPERDGLDVLPEIVALPDAPPVVYVTGAQDGRLAVAALRAGAADYVIKDVAEDFTTLLRAALEDALVRGRLKRDNEAAIREIERARDRAEAMLREVNHRVGNSLQLVSSFISLQARRMTDPQAAAAFEATRARIDAVAQVHKRLYAGADIERVDLKEYLLALGEELSQSLCGKHQVDCVIEVTADAIDASPDKAVAVGVLVAELVTNAVKYAYPPGHPGAIRVRLSMDGDQTAALSVEDDGVGFDMVLEPKGTGVGRTVIVAMARDLGSEVVYAVRERGVRASLVFAL